MKANVISDQVLEIVTGCGGPLTTGSGVRDVGLCVLALAFTRSRLARLNCAKSFPGLVTEAMDQARSVEERKVRPLRASIRQGASG